MDILLKYITHTSSRKRALEKGLSFLSKIPCSRILLFLMYRRVHVKSIHWPLYSINIHQLLLCFMHHPLFWDTCPWWSVDYSMFADYAGQNAAKTIIQAQEIPAHQRHSAAAKPANRFSSNLKWDTKCQKYLGFVK